MKPRLILLALAFGLLWTSGCATSAVFNSGPKQFRPTNPPNMAALQQQDGKRILIVYDEQSEAYRKPVRRAFWIDPQAEPASAVQKPAFVEPRHAKGLPAIAIADEPSGSGYSAVRDKDDPTAFTLYYDREKLWRYKLPSYESPRLTLTESALIPFALAADLTIVGGILLAHAIASGGFTGTY
jgi:hypothetical protein